MVRGTVRAITKGNENAETSVRKICSAATKPDGALSNRVIANGATVLP